MMEATDQKINDDIPICIPEKLKNIFGASTNIGVVSFLLFGISISTGFGQQYPIVFLLSGIPAFLCFFIAINIFIFWGIKSKIKYLIIPIWLISLLLSAFELLGGRNPISSPVVASFLLFLCFFLPGSIFVFKRMKSKTKYFAIPLWLFTLFMFVIALMGVPLLRWINQ